MGVEEGGINRKRLSQLLDGLVVATSEIKSDAEIRVDDRREGIKVNRAFTFGDGFIKSSKADQRVIAKPLMRGSVVWVELNRALILTHRPGKIHVEEIELAEGGVRFCHLGVELQRLQRSFFRFRE